MSFLINELETQQWYCLKVILCSLYIHSYRFYFGSIFVLFFGGISLFSSQNYVILNTERVIKLLTASAKFTIQYMEKILKFNKYKYFETATAVLPIFKLLLFFSWICTSFLYMSFSYITKIMLSQFPRVIQFDVSLCTFWHMKLAFSTN